MSEPAYDRRLRTAAERARSLLHQKGFHLILADGSRFHFIAIKNRQFKLIRIVLDEIKTYDRERVRTFAPGSETISREIWFRKRGRHDFKRIPIPSRK